jgi:hypothetical protein
VNQVDTPTPTPTLVGVVNVDTKVEYKTLVINGVFGYYRIQYVRVFANVYTAFELTHLRIKIRGNGEKLGAIADVSGSKLDDYKFDRTLLEYGTWTYDDATNTLDVSSPYIFGIYPGMADLLRIPVALERVGEETSFTDWIFSFEEEVYISPDINVYTQGFYTAPTPTQSMSLTQTPSNTHTITQTPSCTQTISSTLSCTPTSTPEHTPTPTESPDEIYDELVRMKVKTMPEGYYYEYRYGYANPPFFQPYPYLEISIYLKEDVNIVSIKMSIYETLSGMNITDGAAYWMYMYDWSMRYKLYGIFGGMTWFESGTFTPDGMSIEVRPSSTVFFEKRTWHTVMRIPLFNNDTTFDFKENVILNNSIEIPIRPRGAIPSPTPTISLTNSITPTETDMNDNVRIIEKYTSNGKKYGSIEFYTTTSISTTSISMHLVVQGMVYLTQAYSWMGNQSQINAKMAEVFGGGNLNSFEQGNWMYNATTDKITISLSGSVSFEKDAWHQLIRIPYEDNQKSLYIIDDLVMDNGVIIPIHPLSPTIARLRRKINNGTSYAELDVYIHRGIQATSLVIDSIINVNLFMMNNAKNRLFEMFGNDLSAFENGEWYYYPDTQRLQIQIFSPISLGAVSLHTLIRIPYENEEMDDIILGGDVYINDIRIPREIVPVDTPTPALVGDVNVSTSIVRIYSYFDDTDKFGYHDVQYVRVFANVYTAFELTHLRIKIRGNGEKLGAIADVSGSKLDDYKFDRTLLEYGTWTYDDATNTLDVSSPYRWVIQPGTVDLLRIPITHKWAADTETSFTDWIFSFEEEVYISPDINVYTQGFYAAPTPTPTITVTSTPQQTPTPTPRPTPTKTITISPTLTPTPTMTITISPTMTMTASPTLTPTASPTLTPTPTQTMTASPTMTMTASPTLTPTPTQTMTASPTMTMTASPTLTPTPTMTLTTSPTQTITETITSTPTLTITTTSTPRATITPTYYFDGTSVSVTLEQKPINAYISNFILDLEAIILTINGISYTKTESGFAVPVDIFNTNEVSLSMSLTSDQTIRDTYGITDNTMSSISWDIDVSGFQLASNGNETVKRIGNVPSTITIHMSYRYDDRTGSHYDAGGYNPVYNPIYTVSYNYTLYYGVYNFSSNRFVESDKNSADDILTSGAPTINQVIEMSPIFILNTSTNVYYKMIVLDDEVWDSFPGINGSFYTPRKWIRYTFEDMYGNRLHQPQVFTIGDTFEFKISSGTFDSFDRLYENEKCKVHNFGGYKARMNDANARLMGFVYNSDDNTYKRIAEPIEKLVFRYDMLVDYMIDRVEHGRPEPVIHAQMKYFAENTSAEYTYMQLTELEKNTLNTKWHLEVINKSAFPYNYYNGKLYDGKLFSFNVEDPLLPPNENGYTDNYISTYFVDVRDTDDLWNYRMMPFGYSYKFKIVNIEPNVEIITSRIKIQTNRGFTSTGTATTTAWTALSDVMSYLDDPGIDLNHLYYDFLNRALNIAPVSDAFNLHMLDFYGLTYANDTLRFYITESWVSSRGKIIYGGNAFENLFAIQLDKRSKDDAVDLLLDVEAELHKPIMITYETQTGNMFIKPENGYVDVYVNMWYGVQNEADIMNPGIVAVKEIHAVVNSGYFVVNSVENKTSAFNISKPDGVNGCVLTLIEPSTAQAIPPVFGDPPVLVARLKGSYVGEMYTSAFHTYNHLTIESKVVTDDTRRLFVGSYKNNMNLINEILKNIKVVEDDGYIREILEYTPEGQTPSGLRFYTGMRDSTTEVRLVEYSMYGYDGITRGGRTQFYVDVKIKVGNSNISELHVHFENFKRTGTATYALYEGNPRDGTDFFIEWSGDELKSVVFKNFNTVFNITNKSEFTRIFRINGVKIDESLPVGLKQYLMPVDQYNTPRDLDTLTRIIAYTNGDMGQYYDITPINVDNVMFRLSEISTSKAMIATRGFESYSVPADVIVIPGSVDFSTHRAETRSAILEYENYIYSYLKGKLTCTRNVPGIIREVEVPLRIQNISTYDYTVDTEYTRTANEPIRITAEVEWRYTLKRINYTYSDNVNEDLDWKIEDNLSDMKLLIHSKKKDDYYISDSYNVNFDAILEHLNTMWDSGYNMFSFGPGKRKDVDYTEDNNGNIIYFILTPTSGFIDTGGSISRSNIWYEYKGPDNALEFNIHKVHFALTNMNIGTTLNTQIQPYVTITCRKSYSKTDTRYTNVYNIWQIPDKIFFYWGLGYDEFLFNSSSIEPNVGFYNYWDEYTLWYRIPFLKKEYFQDLNSQAGTIKVNI